VTGTAVWDLLSPTGGAGHGHGRGRGGDGDAHVHFARSRPSHSTHLHRIHPLSTVHLPSSHSPALVVLLLHPSAPPLPFGRPHRRPGQHGATPAALRDHRVPREGQAETAGKGQSYVAMRLITRGCSLTCPPQHTFTTIARPLPATAGTSSTGTRDTLGKGD
jgi:hypothetical protein